MTHRIVMVTSSYPRFAGDSVGSFMEPIAQGVAERGHEVHVVAPWHPKWNRPKQDRGVHFHLFRYAPVAGLNTFGYAEGMRADVRLRASAIAVAPLAMAAGWFKALRVAQKRRASIIHAHWAIPGGVIGAAAAGRLPLVISLHGSDVFVAERHAIAGAAARLAFGRATWVTACSEDLRRRAVALGASAVRSSVVPYGVDSQRFKPDADERARGREMIGVAGTGPLIVAVGRLVRKKGFEYLIDATGLLASRYPNVRVAIAGAGDLEEPLRARAARAGVERHVDFLGVLSHELVPRLLAAADVAVAPSVHDEAGNVDGLPNTVMEIMASGAPLVATSAGGIGAVATHGETAEIVPERDPVSIAAAVERLISSPAYAASLSQHAREFVHRHHSWERVAEDFDAAYARC